MKCILTRRCTWFDNSPCTLIGDSYCRPHLAAGRLVELLPELERYRWPVFLYRPQRSITSPRVLVVFDWLTDIIGGMFGGDNAAGRTRLSNAGCGCGFHGEAAIMRTFHAFR